jgi:hypothetical protein
MLNIIALDVSTSIVGISYFQDNKLISLDSISFKRNKKFDEKFLDLKHRCQALTSFINDEILPIKDVDHIVIEEPLKNSANPNTAAMLNFFHGMLYYALKEYKDELDITYISVDESRSLALSELKNSKGVMWSDMPKTIEGSSKKDYRKIAVLHLISQKYPQVCWLLNSNKTLNNTNYDKADSLVVAHAFLLKNNITEDIKADINLTVSFIGEYFKYKKWIKNIKGTASEKKTLKCEYLNRVLKIDDYINIEVFNK